MLKEWEIYLENLHKGGKSSDEQFLNADKKEAITEVEKETMPTISQLMYRKDPQPDNTTYEMLKHEEQEVQVEQRTLSKIIPNQETKKASPNLNSTLRLLSKVLLGLFNKDIQIRK